ncbi:site-specific integrase [Herbaspirillum huttiense]|jgi:hypothetical protein|uniref:tyrosine-type recombinase/integrase n=1 Tax=Herbaspirillum huttiense TaxID=863372 RepID=UPI001066E279|nr:tyrosine-type recombinase/integrase [Herbaspirillum huttiense]QBP77236.1 site-specific integrase [Herbaspirillum huttiense]
MTTAADRLNTTIIESPQWPQLPQTILSREGYEVDVSGDRWRLLIVGRTPELNFSRIKNRRLAWGLKAYVIDRIKHVSTSAGENAFEAALRDFRLGEVEDGFDHDEEPDLRMPFAIFVSELLYAAKRDRKLYRYYRAIQWYIWCAEHYPELGFCPNYAMELDSWSIPGGPKGEAVRSEELTEGPLHRKLELPLIIDALRNDSSQLFSHVQQRAAMALALAFGRNPLNLIYLWESDFEDLTPDGPERCYVIHMPRIKKRLLMPRHDRKTEYMSPELARHVLSLISRNKQVEVAVEIDGRKKQLNRPLFPAKQANEHFLKQNRYQEAFYSNSAEISNLLADFVSRHNIISPLTGEPLRITTRRLRYTLATNLAAEGISKQELAVVLDHTDTQHVQVYFDVADRMVTQLDKAAALHLSEYVSYFKGEFGGSKDDPDNDTDKSLVFYDGVAPVTNVDIGHCGQTNLCHLDPPYSCYLCPKFRPYADADHDFVLERLLSNRRNMLKGGERSRLGIQLDDVIAAVGEVVKLCEQGSE